MTSTSWGSTLLQLRGGDELDSHVLTTASALRFQMPLLWGGAITDRHGNRAFATPWISWSEAPARWRLVQPVIPLKIEEKKHRQLKTSWLRGCCTLGNTSYKADWDPLSPVRFLTPKVHCWEPPDPWHFMSRGGSDERVSDISRQRRLFKTNSCSSL